MGSPQPRQGRGETPADQEPRGANNRGSSPQHAQNPGPGGDGGGGGADEAQRTGSQAGTGADAAAAPRQAAGPVSTGPRIALRNWRISTRLVSLLALPVVAATTLGGLRINESMNDIDQLEHMQLLTKMTKQATALANALQEERDKSAGPLSSDGKATDFKVTEPRKRTDRARQAFLAATDEIDNTPSDVALESIRASVSQISNQLGSITSIRKDAYGKESPSLNTVDQYSQLITSLLSLSQDMAQATSNPEMIKRTRALAAFSSSKEYASVERAIIAAALPGGDSQKTNLNDNDKAFGRNALHKADATLQTFESTYESTGKSSTDLLAPLDNGNPEIKAADTYAKKVLDSPLGMAGTKTRTYMDWYDQSSNKIQAMKTIEETLLGDMESKARELRDEAERDAIINGAIILLVLGVSLVGAFVVARSMIRSLRRLQDTATRVAQDRLPELVRQLSETDPQDVDTSVESVGVHSRDEIGQVAAAFDDVHREAVRLAAEQALLRGNVNAMFTNLSRRSQGLIQRQLSLISELESREADPDQLSSLFKLDHLATRMRRNGENLLVLAGEEPGRRWTRPVPLVDVLRAAASEVEQYERIELAAVPATEVAGRVVNDLVHLLAELLENATSFSSPQTKVRVTGHALPDGRVLVEIHDTGIGLSPEDLAAINERLAAPPTVDVSVSRRMGLFVVGRLSLRHGIRIQLRPSDSGGTTALVMLPMEVAHGGKQPPKQAQGPQGGARAPGGLLAGGGGAPSGGQRPGLAGPAGAPAKSLGSPAPRGQVGAGSAPRAALPSRDGGQRQQQGSGQEFGNPQSGGRPNQGRPEAPRQGGGLSGAFSGARTGARGPQDAPAGSDPNRPNLFGHAGSQQPGQQNGLPTRQPQQTPQPQQGQFGQGAPQQPGGPGRQLPPSGGPRAELPGGNPQPQLPQPPNWGAEEQGAPRRPQPDTPRGHEEPDAGRFARQDGPGPAQQFSPQNQQFGAPNQHLAVNDRQGPAATAEFARPDFSAPQVPDVASTAQFPRPDFNAPVQQDQGFGSPTPPSQDQGYNPQAPQTPQDQGFGSPTPPSQDQGYNPQTPQDRSYGSQLPQPPAPQRQDDAGFGASHRAALPQQPEALPQQPEALPPAGPGDGRTPLFDTLETNWFHGPQQGGQQPPAAEPQAPAAPQPAGNPAPPMPRRGVADPGATSSWRASPNDELGRQAERVKKPAAGGITTSGLPRRVPRANLVPGTAQQQNHQSGPQVSRAPDDVRGRLTNLRRGIQQGRQANNGPSTGSFHLGPTHQQER